MAEVKRSVIRLDKVRGTKVGHISSVVFEDGELENGFVGHKGALLQDERELRELELVDDVEKPILLVAAPELMYDEYRRDSSSLQKFFTEEGRPARAFEVEKGDIFSISVEGLKALTEADDIAVGNFVVPEVGELKLAEVATSTATKGFVGKIIERETIGTTFAVGQATGVDGSNPIGRQINFVVIEVIQNI